MAVQGIAWDPYIRRSALTENYCSPRVSAKHIWRELLDFSNVRPHVAPQQKCSLVQYIKRLGPYRFPEKIRNTILFVKSESDKTRHERKPNLFYQRAPFMSVVPQSWKPARLLPLYTAHIPIHRNIVHRSIPPFTRICSPVPLYPQHASGSPTLSVSAKAPSPIGVGRLSIIVS